jgi:hypothetical protein
MRSSVRRMRQGAPGVSCSPAMIPSLSQRCKVEGATPSTTAAFLIDAALGGGRPGLEARDVPVATQIADTARLEAMAVYRGAPLAIEEAGRASHPIGSSGADPANHSGGGAFGPGGRLDEASHLLDEADALVLDTDEARVLAECVRIHGQIAACGGDLIGAVRLFENAIAISQRQEARHA